jgi:DNA-binding NarL/FixJ family response regulator
MNPTTPESKPGFQSHRPIRTLLVDDSEFMRKYLARLIELERGFEVVGTAADGFEAIRYVGAHKPDLVLMDVNMPCLNGIEATRSIKHSGKQSGYAPVIIIVTSEDTLACRSQAKKAGANGFVEKSEHLRVDLKSTLDGLFSESGESLSAGLIESSRESSCA